MIQPVVLAFALAGTPAANPAVSIPEPPRAVSGIVLAYAEDSTTLKDGTGKPVDVPMTRGWTVSQPRTVTVDAVKVGDFIASRNENIDPESGRALEVRILEPGYKPEEGTHLVALPSTSITHGIVQHVARSALGQEITVASGEGSRRLVVPPNVEVTAYDLLDRSLLKPNVTAVTAVTRQGADGVWRAGHLVVAAPSGAAYGR